MVNYAPDHFRRFDFELVNCCYRSSEDCIHHFGIPNRYMRWDPGFDYSHCNSPESFKNCQID